MPNMGQVINSHNSKISAQNNPQPDPPGYNCREGLASCPVRGVRQTTGEDNGEVETYTGLTSRSFK